MTDRSASTDGLTGEEHKSTRRDVFPDQSGGDVSTERNPTEEPDGIPEFLTNWSRSRRVAFGGATLIGMAAFLPWFFSGIIPTPMAGIETTGVLTLLAAGVIVLLVFRGWNRDVQFVAAFLGLGVALLTVYYLVNPEVGANSSLLTVSTGQSSGSTEQTAIAGPGLYVSLLGALAVVAAAVYSEYIESPSEQSATDVASDAAESQSPALEDSDGRQGALLDDIASYMDDHPVVTDTELKHNLYADHPMDFDDMDAWWDFVEAELESRERFVRLDSTGRRWALVESDGGKPTPRNS